MKRIFYLIILFLALADMKAQVNIALPSQSYVIGLTKISNVQLNFVKGEIEAMSKVKSAEFVFNDYVLLVHPDTTSSSPLEYQEVEKILLKYFNQQDIYRKDNRNTTEVKSEYTKTDKFIIK